MNVERVNKDGHVKVIVDEKAYRIERTTGGMFVSRMGQQRGRGYFVFVDVSPRVDDELRLESFWWRTILLVPTGRTSYGQSTYGPRGSFIFFDSLTEALTHACRQVLIAEVEELERNRVAEKAFREASRRKG